MIIKLYDRELQKYVATKDIDTIIGFSDIDIEREVECCECGKKVRHGSCYLSNRWFSENEIWGAPVCEECHIKLNKEDEK